MRNWLIGFGVLVLGLAACNQNNPTLATANLLAVDDLSFVCVQTDGSSRLSVERGRPIEECSEAAYSDRRLLALATQRETGEVAVLDASPCAYPSANSQAPCSATMVDVETSQPGLNFLPVGAEPVGIVSTPGGTASFVAVAEPGKTGIFGLPSTCVGSRKRGGDDAHAVRDIRTWSACRLPVAPSSIALFRDQSGEALRCDEGVDADHSERECPADLSSEARRGRLKLAVTLSELGELWTFDAQEVLDRAPGSYRPCVPETTVALRTERPDELTQAMPADLSSEVKVYSGLGASFVSTPTDIAADLNANHGQMYVADRTAPLIHVLDTRNACAIEEVESLYPVSYTEPNQTIATRRVALSPVIDSGARYVYAVEESARATAGSLIAFDVSPTGPGQRTPLVFEGSPLIPDQVPDRVGLGSVEASDVEFIFRDPEVTGADGVSISGIRCEPDPAEDASAGALFRPSTNGGAGPNRLRGLFAMASLHNGNLVLIDVEDYDAPCRRPRQVSRDEVDPRCPADATTFPDEELTDLNEGDTARVTDEATCRVVQPHHVRARTLYTRGSAAPRLRSLPRLRSRDGTSLLVDQSPRGLEHPRLLAPYGQAGELTVGSVTLSTSGDDGAELVTDPKRSEGSNLILPTIEPRSYWKHTGLGAATYEGVLSAPIQARVEITTGRDYERSDIPDGDSDAPYAVLGSGPGALLCSLGIEDSVTISERADEMKATASSLTSDVSDEDYRRRFADDYGDYIEILEPLLADSHEYWRGEGNTCGEQYRGSGVDGRGACEIMFGSNADGQPRRYFRIVRAFDDELLVEPRQYGGARERDAAVEMLGCCFPDATWYVPRAARQWVYREASTLSHDIVTGESGECRRGDDPTLDRHAFRAFEVSCSGDTCDGVGAPSEGVVPVCVLDSTSDGSLSAVPDPCIFNGLSAQFAVYRGEQPSVRDMEFSWVMSGGFSPFVIPMTSFGQGKKSNPNRLHFVPQVGRLIITDGGPPSGRDNRPMAFVLMGFENAAGGPDITYSSVNYYYY